MRNETIDETNNATTAKQYTDWHIKTGGYARDMTMRDYFAAQSLAGFINSDEWQSTIGETSSHIAFKAYALADAMLKERIK